MLINNSLTSSRCRRALLVQNWQSLSELCRRSFSSQHAQKLPRRLPTKRRAPGNTRVSFKDSAIVQCEAGKGGDGMIAFTRLFCNPTAGPGGGDGGNGGHVLFQCSDRVRDLSRLPRLAKAQWGANGASFTCTGRSGQHLQLQVPMGTTVLNDKGELLCELSTPGQVYVAARGGAGGKGNAFFLSNQNRAPQLAELGAKGEHRQVQLSLRVLADAGLVGYPNAGKSSLLRCLSRARPKVASYAFTTLQPHVGVLEFEEFSISIADIPGLIEGAHANRGLGHDFLRHVARCPCLVYVIDLGIVDPVGQYNALSAELELYSPGLSSAAKLIVANKQDLSYANDNLQLLMEMADAEQLPIIAVSAKTGANIDQIMRFLHREFHHKSYC